MIPMEHGDQTECALNAEVIERLANVLADHPVSFAMVFGSAVKAGLNDDGDIDLAVEFDDIRPTDDGYSDTFLRLRSDLDERFSRDIDVVDIHTLSAEFARAAFDVGIVVRGSSAAKDDLEAKLAAEHLSVEEAKRRVAAAADELVDDT